MNRPAHIRDFVDTIWEWFAVHKRTLPWRDLKIKDDTERAYHVMVSEIMLQQTQVPRVIIVFKRFLEQFPTIDALAKASNKDVIIAWQGMGYNSRALRLRDACTTVVKQYNGQFPSDFDQLISIKGIGHYTAGAIRNFAFGIPTPCIDTNIRRILHRTFIGPENPDGTWEKSDEGLLELAGEVLEVALRPPPLTPPPREEGEPISREHNDLSSFLTISLPPVEEGPGMEAPARTTANWHAALMDFGSLVQTKSNPKWDICPLTAKGLMKTTPDMFAQMRRGMADHALVRKEPGREVAGKFIPNRIFRGRIVEELRSADQGLTLEEIGRRITIDWSPEEHREWLSGIVEKLQLDSLIREQGKKFVLHD
jgi:A/G-specific adenine glycosylase